MASKRFYWLKLMKDFFVQPKIKKLRKVAGGDTYTIIYLKLQLMTLNDDGAFSFQGIENDISKELALILDEDEDNVAMTIAFLLNNGLLIQTSETDYLLPETKKLIGSESDSAQRMRILRKNEALKLEMSHCDASVTKCDALVTNCDENVTLENRDKSKEIELKDSSNLKVSNINQSYLSKDRNLVNIHNRPDGIDGIDFKEIESSIENQISYDDLLRNEDVSLRPKIDEIKELMVEVYLTSDERKIHIASNDYDAAYVKDRFKKITSDHVRYVLLSIGHNSVKVKNPKSYLLAAIFNSVTTMENKSSMDQVVRGPDYTIDNSKLDLSDEDIKKYMPSHARY